MDPRPSLLSLQPAINPSGFPFPWTHSQAIATETGEDTQGTEGTGGVAGVGSGPTTIMAGGGAEVGPECTKLQVEVCVCACVCTRVCVCARACVCVRVCVHIPV